MKNKFLLCFRPLVLETELETRGFDYSTGQVCTYNPQNKQNSPFSNHKSSRIGEEIILRQPKINSRRSLSGFFKVALFVISLRKRVHHRNAQRIKPKKTISSISSSELENPQPLPFKKSLSRFHSLPINSKKQSIQSTERTEDRVMSGSSSNSGLYLLFITLSVTIFLGKVSAILLALTWLYFLPRRSYFIQPPQKAAKSAAEAEKLSDYKKRVIMEGLLERNHHLRRIKSFT